MTATTPITLSRIEPVAVRGEHYGLAVQYNHTKQHIKFTSEFHAPTYVDYAQLERVEIRFNNKRTLLWWGIATFLLGIGIFLLLIRIRVPNWKVLHYLKPKKPLEDQDANHVKKSTEKPIFLRAWMEPYEATRLADYLSPDVSVVFYPK